MKLKIFIYTLIFNAIFLTNCSTIKVSVSGKKEQIQDIKKIAILPIDMKVRPDMGPSFSNSLSIFFIQNNRIEIIERNKKEIDSILAEQKFSKTGLIDETTAAEMGKILGVDAILIGDGEAKETANSPIISNYKLKLINVENGVIIVGVIKEHGIEWTPWTITKFIIGFGYIWTKQELLETTSTPTLLSELTVKKILESMAAVEKQKKPGKD
jgi:hypothetical protein